MGVRAAFDLALGSEDPLSEIDPLVWQNLAAGAASKRHPWNEGFFSTVLVDDAGLGRPRTRTVILRRVDRELRTIDFHTDVRSSKVGELKCPHVCWLFYAADTKMQLRVEGTAELIDGAEADEAWARTPLGSRPAYLSIERPGLPVEASTPPDTSDRVVSASESERGRTNFRIVRTTVTSVGLAVFAKGRSRASQDCLSGNRR